MTEDMPQIVLPEQRRASRFGLAMGINVRAKGSYPVPATLTSMSRYGCTVTGAPLSMSHDLLWVRIPGLESQAAELRWTERGSAGLAFRYPLHEAVADQFRRPDVPCPPASQGAGRAANRFFC